MWLPPFSEATLGEDHVRGKMRPAQLFLEHKGEVLRMVSKFSAQNPLYGALPAGVARAKQSCTRWWSQRMLSWADV